MHGGLTCFGREISNTWPLPSNNGAASFGQFSAIRHRRMTVFYSWAIARGELTIFLTWGGGFPRPHIFTYTRATWPAEQYLASRTTRDETRQRPPAQSSVSRCFVRALWCGRLGEIEQGSYSPKEYRRRTLGARPRFRRGLPNHC